MNHEPIPGDVQCSCGKPFLWCLEELKAALFPFAKMAVILAAAGGTTPKKGEWHGVSSTAGTAVITIEDLKKAQDLLDLK